MSNPKPDREHLVAAHRADQENARVRDERANADAGRVNEAIAAAARYRQMADELQQQEAHSEDLTDRLAQLQREELAAIEAAKLPISGLGLGADGVMLNGIPDRKSVV